MLHIPCLQNHTTWLFESSFEVRGTGFFWSMIENSFGAEVKEKVRDLKLTKDKMVCMPYQILGSKLSADAISCFIVEHQAVH